jgi:hypothetical protein
MANLLTRNPIVLTTTQTSYKAAVAATLGTLFTLMIEKVYWEDPITVGDGVLIESPDSGAELLTLRCETAGQSQVIDWTNKPKLWRDFACVQMDSGSLKIYTR